MVVAGETWTLTLTSGITVTRYTHLATGTDLQAVLDALVALANADTASPYTADSATDAILVFRLGSQGEDAENSEKNRNDSCQNPFRHPMRKPGTKHHGQGVEHQKSDRGPGQYRPVSMAGCQSHADELALVT